VKRLTWQGTDTLSWVVQRHALVAGAFGVAAVAVWFIVRRPGSEERARTPLTALCLLLAAQGILGFAQYRLHLPAGMVWVHVALATLSWLTTLWAVASAGRLAPARRDARVPATAAA
jgi:cytochrome c oxidase assembly protein subunit 15